MSYLLTAFLSAVMAFGGAWQLQTWRFDAQKLAYEKSTRETAQAAQNATQLAQDKQHAQLVAATQRAHSRAAVLDRDARHARADADGLRRAAADSVVAATTAPNACPDTATAIGELLAVCGGRYQELGEAADRHVNDINTLIDAWPR